jgi:anti-sigma factor RsiW
MMAAPSPPTAQAALLVHAYLDGELDPANALAIKQQIESDGALQAEFAEAAALQKLLRERFPREPVPARLRSRIDAAVGLAHRWPRPTWQALAASLVLAVALSSGSTWLALRAPNGDRIVGEVVDGHMRALIAQKPADVSSSERHTVKPWFNGRVAQAPRVVDLSAEGFPLVGARIDVIGAEPVPTLVFGRRLHVISLSAVRAAGSPRDPTVRGSINGYNIVSWHSDGITYWAVSDLNAGELETFAKLFQAAPAG